MGAARALASGALVDYRTATRLARPVSLSRNGPMSNDDRMLLYDVSGSVAGEATLVNNEVTFPDAEMRWTWVLDARHAPYNEMELKDVLHRAEHARKKWVLVNASAS